MTIDMTIRYRHAGYPGVAWRVLRYAEYPTWDASLEEETITVDESMVIARMVGDDRDHMVDVDELTPLADSEYCQDCGQIGCGHNIIEED